MSSIPPKSFNEPIIREVWADNLEFEMNKISRLIEKYPYVSMDTEFPGTVHSVGKVKEAAYRNIKVNVDDLKLIQCGISISDEKGNTPSECCTWQFNMKYDRNRDRSNSESIALLINSGIEFDRLSNQGITPEHFGEVLITSGLILNDEIKWVSFHGGFDFAYLLKILSNLPLPETEAGFLDSLRLYFPILFDIRHLTRNLDGLAKSLQRMAQDLDISRIGTQHQAGSDALVTLKVFHKLNAIYLTPDNLKSDENVLFGLGAYYEDETATIFEGIANTQVNYFNSNNNYSNNQMKPQQNQYDMPGYYPNNYNNNFSQMYKPNSNSFTYGYNYQVPGYSPQNYDYMMQGINNQNLMPEDLNKKMYSGGNNNIGN